MSRSQVNFCTNPKTGRRIQIGGRMWLRMVKEGVINGESYEDPNVIYTLQEDEYEDPGEMKEELYKQKKRLTQENTNRNRRPMIYKNKIIMGRNKLTHEETARKTANAAIDVIDDIQNNEQDIPSNMTRDEARQYLQGLIFDKMITQKKKFKNTRLIAKGGVPPRKGTAFPQERKAPKLMPLKIKRTYAIMEKPSKLRKRQFRIKAPQKLRPLKRVPKKVQYQTETEEEYANDELSGERSGAETETDLPEETEEYEDEYIDEYTDEYMNANGDGLSAGERSGERSGTEVVEEEEEYANGERSGVVSNVEANTP